jgi:antitoxin component of MazEF toxin-antitoxin module
MMKDKKDQTFETNILQIGNNTGISVPPEIVEQLNAGKKPPVTVTINNFTYRNTIAVMG